MSLDHLLDDSPSDNVDSTSTISREIDSPEFGSVSDSGNPCCEKCGVSIVTQDSLACRQCGWYASINGYVELERSWEIAVDPKLATAEDTQQTPEADIPAWAWILGSCLLAVVLESFAACLLTAADSIARTYWSLTQLSIGFLSFTFCHTYCYCRSTKNDSDVKTLDYLLRPIKTWSVILRDLPERAWVCYVGLSGFLAMAMSVLVLGAIPYEKLIDWKVEEPPKSNLLSAIAAQTENIPEQDQTLEEAMKDFADKGALDEEETGKKSAPVVRQKEDCIIIGFLTNHEGEIRTLLLAAEHQTQLKFVGYVTITSLPEQEQIELSENLLQNKTAKAFVKNANNEATWVKPKFLCRVSFQRQSKQGGLIGTKIEKLLGTAN